MSGLSKIENNCKTGIIGTNNNSMPKAKEQDYSGGIFDVPKPDTTGLNDDEKSKALKQYNDLVNFKSYEQRKNVLSEYTAKTGENPYATNATTEADEAYNYVNENKTTKGPEHTAQVYSLTTDVSHNSDPKGKTTYTQTIACGQRAIAENDVPIGNTLIAYLSNNNDKATAKIGNTTAEGLADNFFKSTDNIQVGLAPNIKSEKTKDGEKLVSINKDGSGTTKLVNNINTQIKPGDGVLNKTELDTAKYAYVLEAEAHTAAAKLNKTTSESNKRTSSASTVDIDADDPYDKFFEKAGKIDGKSGVTKAELTTAIKAISEQTEDGGVYFTKEKLNAFLNNK